MASTWGRGSGLASAESECDQAGECAALLESAASAEVPASWRRPFRTAAGVLVAWCVALGAARVALPLYGGGRTSPLRRPADAVLQQKEEEVKATEGVIDPANCQPGSHPKLWSASAEFPLAEVRVLSFNLFWWNLFDQSKPEGFHLRTQGNTGTRMLTSMALQDDYDLMGFQECNDGPWLLKAAGLEEDFAIFRDKHCCMAFRTSRWSLLARGVEWVALDRQWGRRPAQWMRLEHTETGRTLFFLNHHGPIPINSGGVCGPEVVGLNILRTVAAHAEPADAVVLVGDFNSNAASATIGVVSSSFRKAFSGVSFGGIDHIFSNFGEGSVIRSMNHGRGGSDHDAISAFLALPGAQVVRTVARTTPDLGPRASPPASEVSETAAPASAAPAPAPRTDEFVYAAVAPTSPLASSQWIGTPAPETWQDVARSKLERLRAAVRAPLAWFSR